MFDLKRMLTRRCCSSFWPAGVAFWQPECGEVLGTITAATHVKEICLSLGGKKISARGFNQMGWKVENLKIFEFQQKTFAVDASIEFHANV